MALFDLFKKKEPVDSKKKLSDDVIRSQAIAAELLAARIVPSPIPAEKLDEYRKVITALSVKFDKAKPVHQDTKPVDEKILNLAKLLPGAIKSGSTATIDRIISGISYGEKEARKDFVGSESAWEAVGEDRLAKLTAYESIAALSSKNDEISETMEQQKAQVEKYLSLYTKYKETLHKTEEARPDLVEELAIVTTGHTLSAGALHLSTMRTRVSSVDKEIENLRTMIATNDAKLASNESTIRNLISQLTQVSAILDNETKENIRNVTESFLYESNKIWQDIEDMDALNEKFNETMESLMSSQTVINKVIRTEMNYADMIRKEKSRAEAMRRAEEIRAKNTNATLTN